jgi:tRNA-specific 2-thiouridylase
MSERLAVAMSGGVDSSVAAALVKRRGFDVVGLTMSLNSTDSRCCSEQDVTDARRVAQVLGIPHYVVSFQDSFRNSVIDYFIEEYVAGRTPNPCAVCNPKIKFGVLWDKAKSLGASLIVTGHYANVRKDPDTGRWLLLKGKQKGKDQSYFLSRLSQDQLSRAVFEIGRFSKTRVRELAESMHLPVAQKSESQDACFIPETGVAEFIRSVRGTHIHHGKILGIDGTELGNHTGIIGYTIGQRKGLGIALGRPAYVTEINAEENTITVGHERDLLHHALIASDPVWISIPCLEHPIQVMTRIRYRHRAALSTIEMTRDGKIHVRFEKAQRAITPGQLAVFYDGDAVIGSAWIEKAIG